MLKRFPWDKYTSLFVRSVSDKEKKCIPLTPGLGTGPAAPEGVAVPSPTPALPGVNITKLFSLVNDDVEK